MPTRLTRASQRGSVIIVTMWTITLVTILVTAMAGQIRLSARTALFHREELGHWSALLAALNQAEMELVMEKMPLPIETLEELADAIRNPAYRYNGQPLQLSYPQSEDIVVRIYNHAGKINLRGISTPRLRGLLEKRLGENADPRQLEELLGAWGDWHDLNDQPSASGGAEVDYYSGLELPHDTRNGPLETVEEILLIRGFAEVFEGVDLDAAFTIYGEESGLLNLNVATIEAMQMLPGLDDELIEEIIRWRAISEFVGNGDVAQIVPPERMAELRAWLNSREVSSYYTILAYRREAASQRDDMQDGAIAQPADPDEELSEDMATHAYAEIVQVTSFTERPRVLKTNPYQTIPIRMDAVSE